jgi:hypothetical protein
VRIHAGQTVDLWLGINVTGKVYYSIRTEDGKNDLRLWWIKQPLGRVQQLGVCRNDGSVNIPAFTSGVLSAKLRGRARANAVVYLRENVAVDRKATFDWP